MTTREGNYSRGMSHYRARFPELHDPEWLRARYVEDGLSQSAIAELIDFDCTRESVHTALVRFGIARPGTDRARRLS